VTLNVMCTETLRTADTHCWCKRVSIIIPVYNEAEHIEAVLKGVADSPIYKQIIIVDDGSTDGTRAKLLELNPSEELVVLFHPQNLGKGASIRTALQYAIGEYVLIQDSDLEYSPTDYPALLSPLKKGIVNVVFGYRSDRPNRGVFFYLGSRLLTYATNVLYGAHLRDQATCYKAFRANTLRELNIESQRFEFCSEVTAKLCRLGEPIIEVPIAYKPRSKQQGKKIKLKDGFAALRTLIRIRFARPTNFPNYFNATQTIHSTHACKLIRGGSAINRAV
jgi:dolichol-phosphate mannosyltransferase